MALPIIPALVGAVGSWFVKRVTTVADDGTETEHKKPRPVPIALTSVVGFFILWYFLLHPILSYHFPEYGFPSIGAELLSLIINMG